MARKYNKNVDNMKIYVDNSEELVLGFLSKLLRRNNLKFENHEAKVRGGGNGSY